MDTCGVYGNNISLDMGDGLVVVGGLSLGVEVRGLSLEVGVRRLAGG